MDNKHAQKHQNPNENLKESSQNLPDSRSDYSFGLGIEIIDGKVREIAGEMSENKSDGAKNHSGQQSDNRSAKVIKEEDKALLKERLLKNAPKEPEMRRQVKEILLNKEISLKDDLRKYSRKREYYLLNATLTELRSIVRQLEMLANASYELLKEIWLKVVHKFA